MTLSPKGFSVESNPRWRDELIKLGYRVQDTFPPDPLMEPARSWNLIFVDSAPEGSRVEYIKRYQESGEIFILHDSNPDWEGAYGYGKVTDLFPYWVEYTGLYPHTRVLSIKPLDFLLDVPGTELRKTP